MPAEWMHFGTDPCKLPSFTPTPNLPHRAHRSKWTPLHDPNHVIDRANPRALPAFVQSHRQAHPPPSSSPPAGNDPDFKQLGQAGREALRKRLARRSMFQQQEIIASAVVAAARAAVEPSVRRLEHSLRSAAASRAGSFSQRDGAQSPGPNGHLAHQRSSELDTGAGFGGGRGGRESPMRAKSAAVPAAGRRASQVYPASLPSAVHGGSGGGAGGAGAGAEGGGLPRPRSAAVRATHFAPDVESPRPGPLGSQAPASLETAASMPLLSSLGGGRAGQGAPGRGGGPEGLRSAVSAVFAVPLKSSLRVGSSLSAGLGHHAAGSSSNQQLAAAGSRGGVVSHMPGSMADYDTVPVSGGGGGAAAAAGAAAPGEKARTLQAGKQSDWKAKTAQYSTQRTMCCRPASPLRTEPFVRVRLCTIPFPLLMVDVKPSSPSPPMNSQPKRAAERCPTQPLRQLW